MTIILIGIIDDKKIKIKKPQNITNQTRVSRGRARRMKPISFFFGSLVKDL